METLSEISASEKQIYTPAEYQRFLFTCLLSIMYSQSSRQNSIMLAKERLSPKKMKNILVWRLGVFQ
ncbi:hypothetical protein NXW16_08605 [Bacteroides thetaiotaomicron]|nr:hypothetical protein [Bacteroides thetaiotaomicron]